MRIYQTRHGREYDLSLLPKHHAEFVEKVAEWYRESPPFTEFTRRIFGRGSPVLKEQTGVKPTQRPIYDIVTDMQIRLGVKQGAVSKDWEGEVDPEWQ